MVAMDVNSKDIQPNSDSLFLSINNSVHCMVGSFPDEDECMLGISGCEQNCENMDGSYKCTCLTGYRLAPDGKSCYGKQITSLCFKI